ncbi:MAG: hypothetical protein QOH06_745 [Acidobacteriota bacterium]|jgi:hypothetical protein|nr:hypothetical protein [Acidobacteriota bacterium]
MHPRHFERLRRGDCEDFALWTWRQLLAMKLDARFVCGKCGRGSHAWVTFSDSQTNYLFEPTALRSRKLSCVQILKYKPEFSVSARDGRLVYHRHEPRRYRPTSSEMLALAVELVRVLAFSLMHLPWHLVRRAARWRRSQDLKWQEIPVAVNDLLADSEHLIHRLLESGIPVSGGFDDPRKTPEPEKRLLTFGMGVPPERIRDVVRAAGDFVDLVRITTDTSSIVSIGFHRHRIADEPMAELTPELKAVLLSEDLSAAALRAAIASRALEAKKGGRGMRPRDE